MASNLDLIKKLPPEFIDRVKKLFPHDRELHQLLEAGNVTKAGLIIFGATIPMNYHHHAHGDDENSERAPEEARITLNERRKVYLDLYKLAGY